MSRSRVKMLGSVVDSVVGSEDSISARSRLRDTILQ